MKPAIHVSHLSKRFRIPLDQSTTLKYRLTHPRSSSRFHDLYALRDVSFEVPPAEFLGIIGHNGCGKSTLLKVLARIYTPTRGNVSLDGRVSPFLELGVGFNPELTARENVFVNGAVLGLTRRELEERFERIIDFADLRDFVDQKLKNFSSGMQVRLAFAVAIQANAAILLMDEVLAVGDARFQEKCFDVFWRYKREGRTVVLVTHDLASVENYCDRAILLDHGVIAADGTASEVVARYRRLVDESFSAGAAVAQPPQPAEGTRWGSGEVEIREVRLLDGDGKPTQSLPSGASMAIELDYEVHREVGELVFGVAVYRADGLHLAGSNTRIAGLTGPSPGPGQRGRVTYVVDRLTLGAGSYLFSTAVHDRHSQHIYDHIDRAFALRVSEATGSGSLVELGGRWTIA